MKFRVGDIVTVTQMGCGCGLNHIGKVVTVVEAKENGYVNRASGTTRTTHGYKVHPPIGNNGTFSHDGWNGEESFTLRECGGDITSHEGTKIKFNFMKKRV
jgi:hypothetical protein